MQGVNELSTGLTYVAFGTYVIRSGHLLYKRSEQSIVVSYSSVTLDPVVEWINYNL